MGRACICIRKWDLDDLILLGSHMCTASEEYQIHCLDYLHGVSSKVTIIWEVISEKMMI